LLPFTFAALCLWLATCLPDKKGAAIANEGEESVGCQREG
jgi:hypothetical protein